MWTRFVTESEINGYEAMGYMDLGSPARSVDLYSAVVSDVRCSPRNRAYYRARLSSALLQCGDRAQAINEGLSILPDLGERLISRRTPNELQPVRAAAEQLAAEEFCVRFDQAARSFSAPDPGNRI
ncbi:hypothetical protein C1I98_10645 [Spongiactinospora gelatinilytica]|uniref:Uncharacterized protein n=1 Tax=Spongiactinospora gelatinilytica TaxID=2666298 RepID=A0A2W2GR15_9ACTN|nr:hypothetical protein C1I98_10645 [Spongiactinospora gelatinilytica]